MTFTQAQEDYLKKIADIGVAEEEDIVARTVVINAEVEEKNIEAGIIERKVKKEVVGEVIIEETPVVEEPTA